MAVRKTNSPKPRTATKKKASDPKPPAIKPKSKPGGKATHKMNDGHIQLIIDMTIAGYTNGEILAELKKEHGITISENTLCYHRRCRADDLSTTAEQQLKAAHARSPYMQLATRVATLAKAIDKEMKKKNPSGYAIAMLSGQIDTAIKNTESLRLKIAEFEKRYAGGTDEQAQRVLEELERRSHMVQGTLDGVDSMLKIAGPEFMPGSEPVEVVATVIHEPEVPKEAMPELNEDALTTGGVNSVGS